MPEKIENLTTEVISLVVDVIRSSERGATQLVELAAGDSLLEDHGVTSLLMVSLIVALEHRFSLTFSDDDLLAEHFDSVNSIVNLLKSKR